MSIRGHRVRGQAAPLALLAGVVLAFGAPSARADYTYCVGGFSEGAFVNERACNTPEVADRHVLWHFHMWVTDGTHCYECWDENDSTCQSGFLAEPQWAGRFRPLDAWECQRLGAAPKDEIFRMVEGAKVTAENTRVGQPPSTPVRLRTELVSVSPGPHAAGDTIKLVARVVDENGKPRPATGASIVVSAHDGTKKTVAAIVRADGTLEASVVLPPGADATLEVLATGATLAAGESLSGAMGAVTRSMKVDPCPIRARLIEPAAAAVLVGGAPISFRGEFVDRNGARVSTPAGAQIEWQAAGLPSLVSAPATVHADGRIEGSVTLPEASAETTLSLSLVATKGDTCPAPAVEVTHSPLGLAVDAGTLPTRCYVGLPCRVEAGIVMAQGGRARAEAEAFLSDPTLLVTAQLADGAPVSLARAGELFTGELPVALPGDREIVVMLSAGGRKVETHRRIALRWPLKLEAPVTFDLGTHAAGSPWHRNCRSLNLSASTGLEEQTLRVTAQQPAGCRAQLVMNAGGLRAPLANAIDLEMGPDRQLPICLETPDCGSGESPEGVTLLIEPVESLFAAQKKSVAVTYRVEGRGWLACWGSWLFAVLGLALAAAVGYGFLTPRSFGPDDALKLSSKANMLDRAGARRLRELPGGKAGWYRSARVGIGPDGAAVRDVRRAVFVLEPGRGEVVIAPRRGALRRLSPRTRKFEDVGGEHQGATRNAVYEVAGIFFRIL